jgi:hypothetical protein
MVSRPHSPIILPPPSPGSSAPALPDAFNHEHTSAGTHEPFIVRDRGGHSFDVDAAGAAGDGTTNDSSIFNTEIERAYDAGGGDVFARPDRQYKVQTVELLPGVRLRASGGAHVAVGKVNLIGTDSFDVIKPMVADGLHAGYGLEDIIVHGGRHGLIVPGANVNCTYLRMRNVQFASQDLSGIHIEAGLSTVEEWYFDGVGIQGVGRDSVYCASRLDKVIFNGLESKQPARNHYRFEMFDVGGTSNSVTWINPIFHLSGEHGMYVSGNANTLQSWVMINPYSEGDGQTGKNNRTTGTVASGSTSLTVASATGYVNGDSITIAGAGFAGQDLTTTVSNVAGTTITLAAAASTSVTNAAVTNAKWDVVHVASGLRFLTVIAGQAWETFGGKLRYSLNCQGIGDHSQVIGWVPVGASIPIYDPNNRVQVIGANHRGSTPGTGVVRRPATFSLFSNSATPSLYAIPNRMVTFSYSAPTNVTNMTDANEGQTYFFLTTNGNTTLVHGSTIKTNTGANKTLAVGQVYALTLIGGVWYEP